MRRNSLALILLLLLSGGLSGCFDCPIVRSCTDAGCANGLTVEFTGPLPEEFTLTAEASGEAPKTRECSATHPCGGIVFFRDYFPKRVTLTLESGNQSQTATVSPSYHTWRPNGECCPPKCRNGGVTFPNQ